MKTIEMFDFDEAQSKFFKKKIVRKATKKPAPEIKTGSGSDSDQYEELQVAKELERIV